MATNKPRFELILTQIGVLKLSIFSPYIMELMHNSSFYLKKKLLKQLLTLKHYTIFYSKLISLLHKCVYIYIYIIFSIFKVFLKAHVRHESLVGECGEMSLRTIKAKPSSWEACPYGSKVFQFVFPT